MDGEENTNDIPVGEEMEKSKQYNRWRKNG
jgi:hypothetical protein